MSKVILYEGVAPETPAAGTVLLYPKTDGRFYFKASDGVEHPMKTVGAGSGDLLADGTIALTANWDVGSFQLRAETFQSDVVTGAAPFTVASTTQVANLNASLLGGVNAATLTNAALASQAEAEAGTNNIKTMTSLRVKQAIDKNVSARNKIVTGTTYTVLAADNGYHLVFTSASNIAVTLPDGFSVDFNFSIIQAGAGIPTVTPNTDTVNGAALGVAPSAQWKAMYVDKYDTGKYLAIL